MRSPSSAPECTAAAPSTTARSFEVLSGIYGGLQGHGRVGLAAALPDAAHGLPPAALPVLAASPAMAATACETEQDGYMVFTMNFDATTTTTFTAGTAQQEPTAPDTQMAEWERAAGAFTFTTQLAAVQQRLQAAEAALEERSQALNQAQQQAAEGRLASEAAAAQQERLHRQLEQREAVIGQLARGRDDATAERLASHDDLRKEDLRLNARLVGGLAAQRWQYAQLAGDCSDAITAIEDGHDMPCTCCGGSPTSAAALRIFEAAARISTVREEAAYWQETAQDRQLELADRRAASDEARAQIMYLQCRLQREAAATLDAQQLAEEAAEALLQERADHQATRQQLKQAQRPVYRRHSSGSYAANGAARVKGGSTVKEALLLLSDDEQEDCCMSGAAAGAAAGKQADRIPAFWQLGGEQEEEAMRRVENKARPRHRRSNSMLLA